MYVIGLENFKFVEGSANQSVCILYVDPLFKFSFSVSDFYQFRFTTRILKFYRYFTRSFHIRK